MIFLLRVDFRVAAFADTHQVAFIMCTALRERQDMMNVIHRGNSAFRQTHLTKRMLGSVSFLGCLPGFAIPGSRLWITSVFLVMLVGHLLVFRTIPGVDQLRTAWPAAWMFGSVGHWVSSSWVKENLSRID